MFIAVVAGDDTAFYAHEERNHPDSARPIIFRDWKDQTWKGTVITLLAKSVIDKIPPFYI